ncbi:UNVERIFIED_CONTAM: hypothetical protein Sradi_1885700 [Sesamum radiatum]|uniref:Uncharacterized protein n=1 Tax=Sesamum radiatum TaxID=300843 RepID=A0AAW2TXG4_SESRA
MELRGDRSGSKLTHSWRFIWNSKAPPKGFLQCNSSRLEDWFKGVYDELDRADWDYFITICWALWWAHNQRMFEGKVVEAPEVIRLAVRFCGRHGGLVCVMGE